MCCRKPCTENRPESSLSRLVPLRPLASFSNPPGDSCMKRSVLLVLGSSYCPLAVLAPLVGLPRSGKASNGVASVCAMLTVANATHRALPDGALAPCLTDSPYVRRSTFTRLSYRVAYQKAMCKRSLTHLFEVSGCQTADKRDSRLEVTQNQHLMLRFNGYLR
jgi:hypothetical protein